MDELNKLEIDDVYLEHGCVIVEYKEDEEDLVPILNINMNIIFSKYMHSFNNTLTEVSSTQCTFDASNIEIEQYINENFDQITKGNKDIKYKLMLFMYERRLFRKIYG